MGKIYKKSRLDKCLSIILIFAMTVSLCGNYRPKEVEAKENKNKVKVVKELKNERTVNSNTYLLSDGSKKTELFFSNVRYKQDGQLVDYNNEIVGIQDSDKEFIKAYETRNKSQYKYVNKSSDNKVYFSDDIEDGLILNHGKYVLQMTPVMLEEKEEEIEESDTDLPNEKTSNQVEGNRYKLVRNENSNEIKYKAQSKNIEYQYIVNNDGLKENIVINEKPKTNKFEYKIDTKNLYLKQQKGDKGLLVCDKKTDKKIGAIAAPFLIDAEGKEDYESVEYNLVTNGKDTKLELVVDNKYFDDKDIKYPVTIDPTMVWMFEYLSTAMTWSVSFQADSNMHSNSLTAMNQMMSSYPYNSEMRAYLDTSNLLTGNAVVGSGLNISDKYIESATLRLFEASYPTYYTSGTLQLRSVLDSWNPNTITWNNQPEISSDIILSEEMTRTEGTQHLLDITKWAQSIADGEQENNGLVFTAKSGGAALFYGPEAHYIADENGVNSQIRHMSIALIYRDFEPYDDTINLSVEYDEQSDKFITSIEDNNTLEEGVSITGYKIFTRKDNALKFHSKYEGADVSEKAEINAGNVNECVDLRACILYSDGTVKVSNIVTLEKIEDKETTTSQEENTITEETTEGETSINRGYSFEIISKDTDGDGLEDGYEIWDFKTLWNTETTESTAENKVYDLDTDDDGFPDSYEVFTLGTDPAIANESGTNSDGDNWTDLREYQEGTDPWLKDSDFDGTNDSGDSTPRKTNGYTRQTRAAEAVVHKGLYDKEYSETIEGVTYNYITNIYRGDIKKTSIDYGDSSLNKTLKYFYDEKGNNTAIVESYDESYDPNHTQTICITYTYDSNNNTTFICDQRTKYTMTYGTDNEMQSLKVGNQTLMSYGNTELINNAGSDGDTSSIQLGGVIDKNEHTDTYGNGQTVRTITTRYKVAEDDTTSNAAKIELYYDNDTEPTYITYLNSEGEIKKLEDYSTDTDNPVEWNYNYSENGSTLIRSDGFTKSVQTSEDENDGTTTTFTSYGFKNLKNENKTYTSTVISGTETETDDEGTETEKNVINQTLHNNDTVRIETKDDFSEEKIQSNKYNCRVVKHTYEEDTNTHASFNVDIYGNEDDKAYDYTYDLAGNITEIKINDTVKYEYNYDAHGRLTSEKDYITLKEYVYEYNTNGNIYGKLEYSINQAGSRTSNEGTSVLYEYENTDWPDQLTTYNGETITYDNSGNPINYVGGLTFSWSKGRQLNSVTLNNGDTVSYNYNENGLRTYKDTSDTRTTYEWDDNTLLRETVTFKNTNQKADIWYLYDANGSAIGFEYSYSDLVGQLTTTRVYYEKNLQGDVIGLLDARGAEIASYTYDAWGNVTSEAYIEGNEMPYRLNHIGYRGYYRDEETGLYYLQSRYYDAEIGRFINSDDVTFLEFDDNMATKDNLYCYCGNNPITNYDNLGNAPKSSEVPPKSSGYVAPKGGAKKGRTKSGKSGWVDKNGNVWVPDPSNHGGEHWDVTGKNGYVNVGRNGHTWGGKGKVKLPREAKKYIDWVKVGKGVSVILIIVVIGGIIYFTGGAGAVVAFV